LKHKKETVFISSFDIFLNKLNNIDEHLNNVENFLERSSINAPLTGSG